MQMTNHRAPAALLLVGALVLMGCSDDGSNRSDATATTDEEAVDRTGPPGDGTLDSDVAASVGSTEIAVRTIDDLVDGLASAPGAAEQLEGEQGEALLSTLRTQVLSQLVVQEIIVGAATEDFGVEVTSVELDAAFDDMAEEAGGVEALDARLEAAGLDRGALRTLELPLVVAVRHLEDAFGVTEAPEPDGEAAEPSEELQALQQWGAEKLHEAEVVVADGFGTWNPEAGQVEPVHTPEMAPPGQVPPPPGD